MSATTLCEAIRLVNFRDLRVLTIVSSAAFPLFAFEDCVRLNTHQSLPKGWRDTVQTEARVCADTGTVSYATRINLVEPK